MVNGTRDNIINAFFKLASKYPQRAHFSIAEIAEEAQLSRQAIYKNHFNSSDEILHYLHDVIDTEVIAEFSKYDSQKSPKPLEYFAENVIPIIYKRRNWLKLLYSTSVDPNWLPFLKQRYTSWLVQNMRLTQDDEFGLPKESVALLLVNNVLSIIEIWITHDVPDHPQKFAKIFLKLMDCPTSYFVPD